MKAHIYKNGLVRFGTEKYDSDPNGDLKNMFSHLTNRYTRDSAFWHAFRKFDHFCSSINKFSSTLEENKDVIGAGCKWDFVQFRAW
jgi:hypothetical protein